MLRMWEVVLLLAGSGLVDAALAIVETQSSIKYVCADSTDSVVQMFLIIDYIRQFKGAYVAVVAGWGHAHRKEGIPFLKGDVYRGHVGVLLVLCCFMFLWTVLQQSEACGKCITDNSFASNALEADLQRMLGGSSCAKQILSDEVFKIAQNYCPNQIDLMCSPYTVPTNYAERCLIGACNGLVHNNRFRYLFSLVLQAIEIIVCLLLMFITPDVPPVAPANVETPTDALLNVSPKNVDGSLMLPPSSGPSKLLRQRTSHPSAHLRF
jgi:hypothetical protein